MLKGHYLPNAEMTSKLHHTVFVSVAVLAFASVTLVLLSSLRAAPGPASPAVPEPEPADHEGPSVSWDPDHLTQTITPGETSTVSVSFTVAKNIRRASVQISPSLTPFLHSEPAVFERLRKGETRQLVLIFAPALGAPLGTVTGTVELQRSGDDAEDPPDQDEQIESKTLALPLPITLNVWPQHVSSDLRVAANYPPDWSVVPRQDSVVFSNVPDPHPLASETALRSEAFFQVHPLPAGVNGAQLPLELWAQDYFRGFPTLPLARTSVTVAGHPALRLVISEIGGNRIHLYVGNGPDVVEIAYGLFAPQFVHVYEQMAETLRFVP